MVAKQMSNTKAEFIDRIQTSSYWRIVVLVVVSIGLSANGVALGDNEGSEFSVRAGVRFLTPSSAEVVWESSVPGKSSIAYGPTRKLGTIVTSDGPADFHRVEIEDLQPGKQYFYRIGVRSDGGKLKFSPIYELDGRMNYSPPVIEGADGAAGVEKLADQFDQPGGYAVVAGADLAKRVAPSLAAETEMTVVAACESDEQVNDLRKRWYEQGIYGIRLTAQRSDEVPSQIANVVVADSADIVSRVNWRSTSGILVSVGKPEDTPDWNWLTKDQVHWIGRPAQLAELTEWGHQYGSSANGSYVGETLGGVDNTERLEVKWLGRPGADFGIDRNPRMPAPLATGGRLFHQGMNRMIALDDFNGAVLWSLEIPDLRRVNIPRDCGNWCADKDYVYAVTKDCLWRIDAATGKMIETVRLPEGKQNGLDWGYVAVTDDSIIGTGVKSGSAYEQFFSKAAWYDGQGNAATAKVCGSEIFSIDKKYGTVRWSRSVDAVVHSTIAVVGDRMFFVEVDDSKVGKKKAGKLKNEEIWDKASIICLDLATGQEVWKQAVPKQDDKQVIAFGIANEDQFVFESSSEEQFHFVSLDAKTGKQQWSKSAKWSSDNHGAHMQHAVLMDGKIFVQPHIMDATSGEIIKTDTLGKRRGCATPIGAGGSIIYRGGSGPVSLWSLDDDKPTRFARLRPSCWLSTIPAQGMLFSPEAGGGCSCGGWMECSIGFAPMPGSKEDK